MTPVYNCAGGHYFFEESSRAFVQCTAHRCKNRAHISPQPIGTFSMLCPLCNATAAEVVVRFDRGPEMPETRWSLCDILYQRCECPIEPRDCHAQLVGALTAMQHDAG